MPSTIKIGSTGADVRTLQTKLNSKPPTKFPPLSADGIFGPKTLARVKEFQSAQKLVGDGIVGPKTWAKLLSLPPSEVPPIKGVLCGTSEPGNQGLTLLIRQEFASVKSSFSSSSSIATRSGGSPQSLSFGGNSPIRMLDPGQQDKARAVYGESLDFSRIFISNKAGIGNRPFTIAFPDENQIVQIMNCGSFSPSNDTLIHELAHVWQSQHHSDQFRFMVNAVDCQAGAVVANGAEIIDDPAILLHKDHPVQFPFSAYAYLPGLSFAEYAAEQMAQSVENGEAPVIAHMKTVGRNAVDADNVKALQNLHFADRRTKGIKI